MELNEKERMEGPAFEDIQDSSIIPGGNASVLITEGEPRIGKNGYNMKLTLEIKKHTTDGLVNRLAWLYLSFSGEGLKMGGRNVQNAVRQCGIDYVGSLFDKTHPDYNPEATHPQLNFEDDAAWLSMMKFYLTGQLTDDAGQEFTSDNGGLLHKTMDVKIAAPKKQTTGEYKGQEQTGYITILNAAGSVDAGSNADPFV